MPRGKRKEQDEEVKKREAPPRRAKADAEEKKEKEKEENATRAPKRTKREPKEDKKEEIPVPPLAPLVDVIVFGSGETGQLGLGNSVLEKKKPGVVPKLKDKHILKLAVGGMHAAVIIQDPNNPAATSLWTWGCNDQKILGRDTPTTTDEEAEDLSMSPGLVSTLEGKNIVDVTTGDFHMLALDNHGRVYVWGTYKDQEGFLGFTQKQKAEQEVPILLPGLQGVKVTKIASGYNHSLVLTDKGEVYLWGLVWIGRRVSDRNRKSYLTPARIAFPRTDGKAPKIVSVHAGGYHSFAISEDGRVYSWGLNNAGQLGIGNDKAHSEPVEITNLRGKDIVNIVGGQHHSLALSKTGQVYSFGRGSYGQLGHGNNDNVMTPKEISSFVEEGDKVILIGCGDSHSMAITEQGALYVWGFGERSQLGTGEEEDEQEPRRIPFKSYNIVAGGGGGQHSVILGKKKEEPVTA